MECTVCMNYFEDNIYSTYCGHVFCKPCADKMISCSTYCWTCNNPLMETKVHRIYISDIRRNESQNLDGSITQAEIMKTLISDFETLSTKVSKDSAKTKDSIDNYAMKLAEMESRQNEFQDRVQKMEDILKRIQGTYDKLQKIVDEHEAKKTT